MPPHVLSGLFDIGGALRRFVRDERGATAIEYALMAVFIATVIITSVSALGDRVSAIFTTTSTAF